MFLLFLYSFSFNNNYLIVIFTLLITIINGGNLVVLSILIMKCFHIDYYFEIEVLRSFCIYDFYFIFTELENSFKIIKIKDKKYIYLFKYFFIFKINIWRKYFKNK